VPEIAFPSLSFVVFNLNVWHKVIFETIYYLLNKAHLKVMKTILITGATSGIGLALGHWYKEKGERPILLGRRSLESLSDPIFTADNYCQVDLATADAHVTVGRWLHNRKIDTVDVLIHNAGLGWYGDPAEQSSASVQDLVAVNVEAPIRLTHALLPLVQSAAAGKIVFVSSAVSQLPTADYAVYTATKAALDGFARSLRIEQAGRVAVQVLHPGATRTTMHEKIGIPKERMNWDKFPPAADVATQMGGAITTGRRHVAIGVTNKILRGVSRAIPNLLRGVMRKKFAGSGWPASGAVGHVVITGAADGIGRATAHHFAEAGYQVTGIDFDAERSAETVAELRDMGGTADFITADLSRPEEVNRVIDALQTKPPIDMLINNAGISAAGHFSQLPLEEQIKVIKVNFLAPLLLTTGVLQTKRLTSEAQLVFLSSLSRYVGYPGAAVYAATKDGLASYAGSLHVDGRHPTSCTVVYPGPTRTAHARRYSPDNDNEKNRTPPEAVATAIYSGATRRAFTVLPGGGAKVFATLGRIAPRLMEQAMKKVILDKFPTT